MVNIDKLEMPFTINLKNFRSKATRYKAIRQLKTKVNSAVFRGKNFAPIIKFNFLIFIYITINVILWIMDQLMM